MQFARPWDTQSKMLNSTYPKTPGDATLKVSRPQGKQAAQLPLRPDITMSSLQDQLLQAGMVDAKKAKQVAKDKRRDAKQVRRGEATPDNESKNAAQQAKTAKLERDRESNRAIQERAHEKAIAAQIVQLIERHRIAPPARGEVGYQFVDGKKIKKLHVDAEQQRQLERGQIGIVRLAEHYALVPAPIAAKIALRDAGTVVLLNDKPCRSGSEAEADAAEDPYADFKVPDDLMW